MDAKTVFAFRHSKPMTKFGFQLTLRTTCISKTLLCARSSALEQLKTQQEEAKRQLREENVQRKYHEHLDLIASGDEGAIGNLANLATWNALNIGDLSISENGYRPTMRQPPLLDEVNAAKLRTSMDRSGFETISASQFEWNKFGVDFRKIAATMEQLVTAGWPPVFIFMFDEPWKVCCRLFDCMGQLIEDDELLLEHSMYAWALHRPELNPDPAATKVEKVGTNFGTPHRDITYSNCHSPVDGKPEILSIWIPVVDISTENGCMYVVPRERDPQFSLDVSKKDQDPFSHKFQYDAITPLAPIDAGSALIWHPNLRHWGSSCRATSRLPPRKSIAMAFRVRDSRRPSTEKEVSRYGRSPFTRDEMLAGGPTLKQRIQMIAKALMLYNVWYPEYHGFDLGMIAATTDADKE